MTLEKTFHGAASQCWVEHQTLVHIKEALRMTLRWDVPSFGLPRKLSSVTFMLDSFHRHLERLMNLEEDGGYMASVEEANPNLSYKVKVLQHEHDQFRTTLSDLQPALEILARREILVADDEKNFIGACREIDDLLRRVDFHDAKENDLLYEAFQFDQGGES
jgi:hemerythrin-like domain-containing protein